MPLSYHGFAPAAILIMIATIGAHQLYGYWKRQYKGRKYF